MVQAVCTFLSWWMWSVKRLKHGLSQVWGNIPPPKGHHHVQMAQIQPALVLGAIWGECTLSCGYCAKYGATSTARGQGGSLLQQLWGGWGRGGIPSRNSPLVSLCSSLPDIIDAQPSAAASSPWPSQPHGHKCILHFAVLSAACLSPRISCGHSRKGARREADLRSRPAPLLLQLGNPVKNFRVKPIPFPGCPCCRWWLSAHWHEHQQPWIVLLCGCSGKRDFLAQSKQHSQ